MLYCIDGNGPDRVFLGAPRHFVGVNGVILRPTGSQLYWIQRSNASVRRAVISAPPAPPSPLLPKNKKIPRPPNAYILYRKERHQIVKESNPGITNNEICTF